MLDWRTRPTSEDVGALPIEIVSIGCRPTKRRERWSWHRHPFDELCLIAEDSSTIGHAGKQVHIRPNTMTLFLEGEEHGFWNGDSNSPDLWVVHFSAHPSLRVALPSIFASQPDNRMWALSPVQVQEIKGYFVKMSAEYSYQSPEALAASSAWMQLLLSALVRLRSREAAPQLGVEATDPELMRLWTVINESVGSKLSEMENLPDLIENYDSLRHRFRKVFGISPRAMMLRLRMQRAQQMLLEGGMTVKEIAHAVGYWRQHEFTRAFSKAFGMPPSEYRRRARTE